MELYYLCCENKGADQLCSYCTADLKLISSFVFTNAQICFSPDMAHIPKLSGKFVIRKHKKVLVSHVGSKISHNTTRSDTNWAVQAHKILDLQRLGTCIVPPVK